MTSLKKQKQFMDTSSIIQEWSSFNIKRDQRMNLVKAGLSFTLGSLVNQAASLLLPTALTLFPEFVENINPLFNMYDEDV